MSQMRTGAILQVISPDSGIGGEPECLVLFHMDIMHQHSIWKIEYCFCCLFLRIEYAQTFLCAGYI